MNKRASDSVIDSEKQSTRFRAGESDPQSLLECNMNGLYFISLRNKNNKPFIPSTKNYFGGIQVRKVLCDTGCNTFLLPLEEAQLRVVFETFPVESHFIQINSSTNVGGKSPVLNIAKTDGSPFEVSLCQDLISSKATILVKILRFHLCSVDVLEILNSTTYSSNLVSGRDLLVQDSKNHQGRERKSHALLGQSVIKNLSSVRSSKIEFFVDRKLYNIESWKEIEKQTILITSQINLPDCFEDWEDDDNVGLDAGEDYECSD
eukprot:gene22399-29003_t